MRTALLIIDLQLAILDGLATPERQPAIDATLDLVAARLGRLKLAAEVAGVPVILVQHDGDPGHRLAFGSPGWQLRTEVEPGPETLIVHKRSCDAFHETDLATRLADLAVGRLVIGGCMTQYCVDTTARSAVSRGFNVALLQDGHATADFGDLTADQVVAHHNRTLAGFSAGDRQIHLVAADGLAFPAG